MRAYYERGTAVLSNTQISSLSMTSLGDPTFARRSTLRTIERTVVDDFGDDPVVFAQNQEDDVEKLVSQEATLPENDEDHDELRPDDIVEDIGDMMHVSPIP